MKITAKQYALSLYESVEEKTSAQVKAAVKKFIEFLAAKNQLARAEKIVKEFSKIWNDRHGVVEAEISSAKTLDKQTIKLLKNYVIKLSGAKEIAVDEKVDKGLLGGMVIRYGDKVLDGSLKTVLSELKEKIIK